MNKKGYLEKQGQALTKFYLLNYISFDFKRLICITRKFEHLLQNICKTSIFDIVLFSQKKTCPCMTIIVFCDFPTENPAKGIILKKILNTNNTFKWL